MGPLLIILSVLDILVCICIVILVLLQDTHDRGMGTLAGGSNDSFYSSNMGRTKDVLMRRMTIILGAVFACLTILIGVLLG